MLFFSYNWHQFFYFHQRQYQQWIVECAVISCNPIYEDSKII